MPAVTEPFVTYAQNFEDVMLWRALRDVPDGFYVDVGAGPPTSGSVTLALYERGWHGINIEPDPTPFEGLVRERTRDVNLNLAVSNVAGERPMYFVRDTGNSTLVEAEGRLREQEGRTVDERVVPVSTLASIWDELIPAGQDVHFLKVDVEGAEAEVLEGLDFRSRRPWIVVVEATRPNSTEPSHGSWEGILLDAGYAVVHRDGLNRFYLASEHDDLRPAFDYPPNYWDHFVPAAQRTADRRAVEAGRRAVESERRAREARAALAAIKGSWSWRLTRPLRVVLRTLRRLR